MPDNIAPNLTPTEELVLDVLAARRRLGENLWTLSSRVSRQVDSLAARGLVTSMHGMTEGTIRASLTEAGVAAWLSPDYMPPIETDRLKLRNRIYAALNELGEPEAASLSTYLSHKIGGGV